MEHLRQSYVVWNLYQGWELRILQALPDGTQERVVQLKRMHQVWIDRLATPHASACREHPLQATNS